MPIQQRSKQYQRKRPQQRGSSDGDQMAVDGDGEAVDDADASIRDNGSSSASAMEGDSRLKQQPSEPGTPAADAKAADSLESSSTGGTSSDGKGDGSGAGYSADYSGSASDGDQSSSDDAGSGKKKTEGIIGGPLKDDGVEDMKKSNESALPFSLETLHLGKKVRADPEGNSNQEENSSLEEDEREEPNVREVVERRRSPRLKRGHRQPSHRHHHHHTNGDGESSKVSSLKPPPAGANEKSPPTKSTAASPSASREWSERSSSDRKSRRRARHSLELEEMQRYKDALERETALMRYLNSGLLPHWYQAVTPQWNGVRIVHPMDPRIDLTTVGTGTFGNQQQTPQGEAAVKGNDMTDPAHLPHNMHIASLAATVAEARAQADAATAANYPKEKQADQNANPSSTSVPPSIENYLRLMEVVHPFFHAQGVPYVGPAPADTSQGAKHGSGSDETNGPSSSEGFTSFFTTTHSSANNSGSTNSSDQDKKPAAKGSSSSTDQEKPEKQATSPEAASDQEDAESNSSSLVVLARTKRKYRRSDGEEEATSSSSSRERRVRIQEHPQAGSLPASEGASAEASNSSNGDTLPEKAVVGPNARLASQESTMSSSSSDPPNVIARPNPPVAEPPSVPPRIVTDTSSSNRTSSSNPNSGSGSGSAGNTGSGSNQGSSASGNDGSGSGNDGKASSEENKEDGSGEGTNDGSDGTGSEQKAHVNNSGSLDMMPEKASNNPFVEDQVMQETEEAARERKILDKKRKRIEMRREYEAQQQSESSENASNNEDYFLRPGRPVSIDQVLRFSRIPRLLLQSKPPFLVVHTNAAFSRLTGIDSHAVIGKPVSNVLIMPDDGAPQSQASNQDSESNGGNSVAGEPSETAGELAVAAAAGRARASMQNRKAVGLERLVASSGFGHLNLVHVRAKNHHMVGKNVTVVGQGAKEGQNQENREERSNDTSISSSIDRATSSVKCRSSIAPVVTAVSWADYGVVTDRDTATHPMAKRRKQEPPVHHKYPIPQKEIDANRKAAPHQIITHYVIQLHPFDEESGKRESEASLSSNSTSVEARLLGLSKAQLQQQRMSVGQGPLEESEEAAEDMSEPNQDHVTAIG